MFKILVIFLLLLLTACGNKLDGTYVDGTGLLKYTFKSNGKVYQSAMGVEMELPYIIEGDKIKLPINQGVNMVLTLQADGTIEAPMGILLRKQGSSNASILPSSQNKTTTKLQDLKPKSDSPQSNDAQTALKQLYVEEDSCRGGSGDNKATWAACDRRDRLVGKLTKLGWCLGPEDAASYEKSWQPCV
jgi:hypothetical protein